MDATVMMSAPTPKTIEATVLSVFRPSLLDPSISISGRPWQAPPKGGVCHATLAVASTVATAALL